MVAERDEDVGTWAELLGERYLLPTITLALGVALFAFNVFVLATALPSAIGDLGGAEFISWSASLYLIFSIVSGAATGLAKARFGARNVYLAGAAVFIAGTIAAGFAPSMQVLLAGRILQGLGTGLIDSLSYALIPLLFPPRLVPKIFGVEAVMWTLAAFGGPAIGGLLTSYLSWRWALLCVVPFALVFMVLVPFTVPRETPSQNGARFPGVRLALIAVGMLLVTLASVGSLLQAGLLLLAAVAAIVAGILLDRKAQHRLMPLAAFTARNPMGLGFWVITIMAVAEAAIAIYLAYGAQHIFGFSPGAAGGLQSLIAVSWSLSQILISTFAALYWRQQFIWMGAALLAFGLVLSGAGVALQNIALLAFAQLMVGASFGINWGSISQLLMEAADPEEQSLASGLLPIAQSAGFAIGSAIAGLIGNLIGFAQATQPAELSRIIAVVFFAAAAMSLPAIPMAWKVVRKS